MVVGLWVIGMDILYDFDTAGTTVNAASAAIENGAKSVTAVATHAVLSGPAIDRLKDSVISKLIVTDTVSIPDFRKN